MTGVSQFPLLAMKNRKIIEQSTKAGCFHCLEIFDVNEINSYTDNNDTVICPKCGIDSVVGNNCGFDLNNQILKTAKKFWYEKN
jgi:hypothetical protein